MPKHQRPPLAAVPDGVDWAAFWSKIDQSGGPAACHQWTGALSEDGYGLSTCVPDAATKSGWRTVVAHRLAYLCVHGSIPDGLFLDHTCRNRACCNVAHLEVVTNRENVLRGKTHYGTFHADCKCKHGHDLTPDNVYAEGRCKTCVKRRATDAYLRRKAAKPPRQPRTHCKSGRHEWVPENWLPLKGTRVRPTCALCYAEQVG